MKNKTKPGSHLAPFLCLCDIVSTTAGRGGSFDSINIYLVKTKENDLACPKITFLGFSLTGRSRRKFCCFVTTVVFFRPGEVLGCQGEWEPANGSISPKSLCRVFSHVLFPESRGFELGTLRYLEAGTALTADLNADVQEAAPWPCHSHWAGDKGRGCT